MIKTRHFHQASGTALLGLESENTNESNALVWNICPKINGIPQVQFSLYYLSTGGLLDVKTKEYVKLLAPKVIVVAYDRFQI